MVYLSDQLNPKTHWKEEFEADGRDFQVWNILWAPTGEELTSMKDKSVSLLNDIDKTVYQNWRGSCTAAALSNIIIIQNTLDYWTTKVFAEREDLWVKMWHKLWDKDDSWDYLEKALKTAVAQGVDWTVDGKDKTFSMDWYAFKRMGTSDVNIKYMKYYLSKGYPLYIAMRWDSQVYRQMRVGRLERVITRDESTGGHALAVIWIIEDNGERFVQIVNSWKPNDWDKSYFVMKLEDFKRAIDVSMLAWRYRITYDKKDIVADKLFDDYYADENSEDYKAMKFMKDKWFLKGYDGKVFPDKMLTRKEFALVMYRMLQPKEEKASTWAPKEVAVKKPSKKKKGWE